jgi:hypothetical protein
MDDEHDSLAWIVGLEPCDVRGLGVFPRSQQPRELELFGVLRRQHHRQRDGKIRRERKAGSAEPHSLGVERIFKREDAAAPIETCKRRDAVINVRHRKRLAVVPARLAADRDERRAEAILGRAARDVGAVDVELVSRHELVKRGVPLRARVGLVREHEFAAISRHSKRLRPRIELGRADRGEDAAESEIVVAARRGVAGIAPEFPRRSLRCREVLAKRNQWLAAVASQRVRDGLFHTLEHTEPRGFRHKAGTPLSDLCVLSAAGEPEGCSKRGYRGGASWNHRLTVN